MSAVEELTRQLEAAYAAIRELDEDLAAGRLSTADHADLKQRSERQAAALLKRLREAEREARHRRASPSPARPPLGARLRGPIGLTLGAVVLVVAGIVVGITLGRSTSDAPPSTVAAPAVARPTPGGGGVSADLEALRKEVEPETTPTKKLLAFAHLALDEGQTPAAIWAYKRVLAREPKSVEAITHIGIILYQGNHVDRALARLEEALAIDPSYAHAHWDRAQMLFHGKKDYAGAVRAIEAFLALIPTGEDADRARAMLNEARARAAAPPKRGSAPPVTVPVSLQPLPPERFSGKAAQAYRVAHDLGDTLAQLPCYCGCDVSAGHRNLRACFLDEHGST